MSFFKGIGNKVGSTFNQGHKQQDQEDDQSLATLLTRHQRAELSVLISQTTESMRQELVKCFDEQPRPTKIDKSAEEQAVELSKLTLPDTGDSSDTTVKDEPPPESSDQSAETEATLAEQTPESKALKTAALEFFDAWAESVILRIGEVVNSRDHQETEKNSHHASQPAESSIPEFRPSTRDKSVDQTLHNIYPAIPSTLGQLTHLERAAILNAILLLLLSLESYRAHSRTLLIRFCISLDISVAELNQMEKDTAIGLLKIAGAPSSMDASESTTKAQKSTSNARKWKVGAAGVAGAALIGITGGLAAPLIAAGVGTLMGGLGLGATAAAGYLGALAGNAALVGGLFGAYGARMSSQTMDKYAKEIEDFAFLPLHEVKEEEESKSKTGQKQIYITEDKDPQRPEDAPPLPPRHTTPKKTKAPPPTPPQRLRLTIAISGYLQSPTQTTQPWLPLTPTHAATTPYALRWELSTLLTLGSALRSLILSQAYSKLRSELLKRTILAALYTALMAPLAVRKVVKLADSPFSLAKIKAWKAGEVLADALINRVQGERPVSLVGMSLGSRVIYSCLLSLARRNAFGLVQDVVLMGSAVPSTPATWRAMRSVVSGRLINAYSDQDYVLAILYRTSSAQMGVAGIQAVEGVRGVENYDVGELVGGHLGYMGKTGRVLELVGWEDLDMEGVERQEREGKEDKEVEKVVDAEKKEVEDSQDGEKEGGVKGREKITMS